MHAIAHSLNVSDGVVVVGLIIILFVLFALWGRRYNVAYIEEPMIPPLGSVILAALLVILLIAVLALIQPTDMWMYPWTRIVMGLVMALGVVFCLTAAFTVMRMVEPAMPGWAGAWEVLVAALYLLLLAFVVIYCGYHMYLWLFDPVLWHGAWATLQY